MLLFVHASIEIKPIEDQMAAFWCLKEIRHDDVYTTKERLCKRHFEKNVRCDQNGWFVVLLPFKDTLKLEKIIRYSFKTILALEGRFQSDDNWKTEYVNCIKEYIKLGHMSFVQPIIPKYRCYYLPHLAIYKESSISTKFRVVFDASAKTNTNLFEWRIIKSTVYKRRAGFHHVKI